MKRNFEDKFQYLCNTGDQLYDTSFIIIIKKVKLSRRTFRFFPRISTSGLRFGEPISRCNDDNIVIDDHSAIMDAPRRNVAGAEGRGGNNTTGINLPRD